MRAGSSPPAGQTRSSAPPRLNGQGSRGGLAVASAGGGGNLIDWDSIIGESVITIVEEGVMIAIVVVVEREREREYSGVESGIMGWMVTKRAHGVFDKDVLFSFYFGHCLSCEYISKGLQIYYTIS